MKFSRAGRNGPRAVISWPCRGQRRMAGFAPRLHSKTASPRTGTGEERRGGAGRLVTTTIFDGI